jgi:hypothetical protein
MYSAFSFGKIIKTILPGSILAGTLFLVADTLWLRFYQSSLLAGIIAKDAATVAGAALVPVSLLLGFLLNTFVWMYVNRRVRRNVDAALAATPFAQLRDALCERMRREIEAVMGPTRAQLCSQQWPDRLTLEYYFLPAVTVEHLTYLWESYFSWYEFQLNTVCALIVACVTSIGVLAARAPLGSGELALVSLVLVVSCALTCRMLWKSAIRNMLSYEKNLVVMITRAIAVAPAAT